MNKIMLTLLFSFTITGLKANQSPQSEQRLQSPTSIFQTLKEQPETPLTGPFLLNIKSITMQNNVTYMNTKADINDPMNIVLEIPAFIRTQLSKKFKTEIDRLFLNQNLVVNGQLKLVESKFTGVDNNPKVSPTLKVTSINQLALYD